MLLEILQYFLFSHGMSQKQNYSLGHPDSELRLFLFGKWQSHDH